jgi:integrin beta 8
MAILQIDQLKSLFERGDFPRQQDFWDLIDTLNEDKIFFGASAPEDEITYPLWLNTSTERLSVFYNDSWISIGDGADGADGAAGADGEDGLSAYEVALENGFSGTQQQWLTSLIGAAGSNGTNGTNGTNGADSTVPGPKGDTGDQGSSGIISVTAPITNSGTSTEANIGIDLSTYYTSSQVDSAIAAVIDAAPGTLNTLNELAAAINDDASYAATMTTALGNKQDKVSGVSDTEIGYLDGVTSAIQTQINSKQATVANVSDTEIGYLDGVTSSIQSQLNNKAVYPSQSGNTGKYLKTDGSTASWELVGGGLFPIWGERSTDPTTGQYFAFGNGSTLNKGILITEGTTINSLAVSTTTAVTGTLTLEIYKNSVATGKTVSLTSGNTKAYASGLNLSVSSNDTVTIYTVAGGVGGGATVATMWLVNAGAVGPTGPQGIAGTTRFPIFAERNSSPTTSSGLAYGNGADTTTVGAISVPYNCTLDSLSVTASTAFTGTFTIEAYKNGSSTSKNISVSSGQTKGFVNNLNLSFSAGDTFSFFVTAGGVGGTVVRAAAWFTS